MSGHDRDLMALACDLAMRCPRSETAFAVGAVIADRHGQVLATGFSRQDEPKQHGEEAALARLPEGAIPHTIYCSLEPCRIRASARLSCSERIVAAGFSRVVYAAHEPATFVAAQMGLDVLRAAGIKVDHLPGFEERFAAANAHLDLRP